MSNFVLSPEELQALAEQYKMKPEDVAAAMDAISGASTFDESAAALAPQMDRAQGYADAPMNQGRMVSGYYVPPSMLSSLSQVATKGLGQYGLSGLQDKQTGLIDALRSGHKAAGILGYKDRESERALIAELLRRAQQKPAPQDPQHPGPWASGYVPNEGY